MIRISEELVRRIEDHGQATYPEECCGILLGSNEGDETVITGMAELDNYQPENRRRRFLITPGQYLQAERIAYDRGLELLGFYHSHPDHPAIPSEFDREHALPWFTYLVLAVERGRSKAITAWHLSETRESFIEKSLAVEEVRTDDAADENTGGADVLKKAE